MNEQDARTIHALTGKAVTFERPDGTRVTLCPARKARGVPTPRAKVYPASNDRHAQRKAGGGRVQKGWAGHNGRGSRIGDTSRQKVA